MGENIYETESDGEMVEDKEGSMICWMILRDCRMEVPQLRASLNDTGMEKYVKVNTRQIVTSPL